MAGFDGLGLFPVEIDVYKKHKVSTINAHEDDANGRGLLVTLLKDGVPFNTTGIDLKLAFRNAIGEERLFAFSTVDLTNGKYSVTYPREMLEGNGGRVVRVEIKAYDTATQAMISYNPLNVYVSEAVVTEGQLVTNSEGSEFVQLLERVETAENAELLRVSEEGSRVSAEYLRATAETGRVNAESSRVSAEQSRVTAEQTRASFYDGFNAQLAETEQRIDAIITTPVPTGEIIAQEIIDARQGKGSVGANITEVKAQLSENTTKADELFAKSTVINPNITPTGKTYLTIVDDDGGIEVLTKLKPISEELNVPMVVAYPVTIDALTNRLTQADLLSLQNDLGWEIASHGYTHTALRDLPAEQIEYELAESKKTLTSWGLNVTNFVAPYGSNDDYRVRQISAKYYNCSARVGGGANNLPLQNQYLNRQALGSYMAAGQDTLAYFKSILDNALRHNSWLILMTHVWHELHDASMTEILREVIIYAKSLGIEIVTMQQGFEAKGNILEVEGITAINKSGEISGVGSATTVRGEVTTLTPPAYFYKKYRRKVVHSYFVTSDNQVLPESNLGTLITYAVGGPDDIWQIWHPYKKDYTYKRKSTDDLGTAWTEFSKEQLVIYTSPNAFTSTTPITDYEAGKILITKLSTGGFPTPAGTLITNTTCKENGYYYQTFRSYNTGRVYERYVLLNGQWSPFVELAFSKSMVVSGLQFDTIDAQSEKEIMVTTTALNPLDLDKNIMVNHKGALPAGLSYSAWINTATTIKIKVFNFTSAPIVCNNPDWIISTI